MAELVACFKCWCGVVGQPSELFDESGLEPTCGGDGFRACTCGGDSCICHFHGEAPCGGCEDCEVRP